MNKLGLAAMVVVGLMFFSTIAYGAIQAFYIAPSGGQHGGGAGQQVDLPPSPILDYRLSPAEYSAALSRGFTVATYEYDINCLGCLEDLRFIEQLATSSEFQNQIYLEEIQSDGPAELEVASAYGSLKLNSTDPESVTRAFCDLVVSQPLSCV